MTRVVFIAGKSIAALRHMFAITLILLLLIIKSNAGTSVTDGSTPLALAPGAPAGSYSLSGLDNINPYNGSLNFRLPLLQVGGRGGAQYTMTLLKELHWRVLITGSHLSPTKIPTWSNWAELDPGYGPGVLIGRLTGLNDDQSCLASIPSLTRLTFIEPDGTEYELRDKLFGGEPKTNFYTGDQTGCFIEEGLIANRGRVFVSADGTAMTFISDADIHDFEGTGAGGGATIRPSGHLFLRDGTYYRILDGLVQFIRDRNGNKVNFHYDTFNRVDMVTDSLNRKITITYAIDPCSGQTGNTFDEIKYTGFEGVFRAIRVNYDCLGNMLRSDFASGPQTLHQLFLNLNGAQNTLFNPRVVSSIALPNGQSYTLRYNPYGELARVVLPTGGAFQYDFQAGVIGADASGVFVDAVYRRVVKKEVYTDAADPNSREGYMTFSRPENISGATDAYVQVDHFDSANTLLARERHYYPRGATTSFSQIPTGYPRWTDGRETKTEFMNGSAVLREVTREWEQGVPQHPLWWTGAPDLGPSNNSRIKSVTTKLKDTSSNLTSKQELRYDQYNNVTDTCDYDFGTSGPGALLRHSHTEFLVSHPSSFIDYTSFNSSGPANSIHMRSLPLWEIVNGSCGDNLNYASRTDFEYDNYTADQGQNPNHAQLVNRADICSHEATFDSNYKTRGNVTAVMRWLNTDGSAITSFEQYDMAGNVVRSKDPRGNPTTFSYVDKFGSPDGFMTDVFSPPELANPLLKTYAFATSITNAKNQTSSTQYSYYVGKPVDVEDPNSIVSSAYYGDSLERPVRIVSAARDSSNGSTPSSRSQTTFSYLDSTNTIATVSDLNTYQDAGLQSTLVYDKLGRTAQTRKIAPEGTISTTESYDAMGRLKQATNPALNGDVTADTYGYSVTSYDTLSRITRIESFDKNNASTGMVRTDYDNNKVTVTDEAGKVRRSLTDGLGRIIRVDEPDTSGSLGAAATPAQATIYGYDVMSNLVSATQQSGAITQVRRFAYDSMSRLILAANPEQVTSASAPFNYNSQAWAVKYDYDAASNLSKKTDTRVFGGQFVSVSYGYDELNRVTTGSYIDGTPNVSYSYDSATKGVGRLGSVTAAGVSTTNYLAYDGLGRVISYNQQTAGRTYQMSSSYNLAGMMTDEVYPSGKTIRTEYDTAGRIAGVKNTQTTNYYAGAAATDSINRMKYTPHGAMRAMKQGNQVWEHTDYNSRLQAKVIGLGATESSSSMLKLEYEYGTTSNNGNMLQQKITAPLGGGTLLLTQDYSYDELNRLKSAQEKVNQEATARWVQAMSYDRWGNRVGLVNSGELVQANQPVVNSGTNRLAGLTYDEAGNQLMDATGRPLAYDSESRVKSFAGGGNSYSYSYDGNGRRVKREYNDGVVRTTVYVYNASGQMIAEYETDPVPPATGGGGTSYLTIDTLGSTRVVTNASGVVKARHDYLAFGEEIGSNVGSRTVVNGYGQQDGVRQKFTSKERDDESGLDYFLARYYASGQGRFTSADEFTCGPDELYDFADIASSNPTFYADIYNPQSLNKYQYCYNNPLRYVDPNGHDPLEPPQQRSQPRGFPGPAPLAPPLPKPVTDWIGNLLIDMGDAAKNDAKTVASQAELDAESRYMGEAWYKLFTRTDAPQGLAPVNNDATALQMERSNGEKLEKRNNTETEAKKQAKSEAKSKAKESFAQEAGDHPKRIIRDRNTNRITGVSAGKATYRPKGDGRYSVTPQNGKGKKVKHFE